jgi:transcriptional regulator
VEESFVTRGDDEATRTLRQELIELLGRGEYTPRELADWFETTMRAILDDLEHVRRSTGARFVLRPPSCPACGYAFGRRRRLNTPSRCPKCRQERIEGPWLSLRA